MDFQLISVDKIVPAKYNPRKDLQPGDPEYEKLKRSMATFGYVEPIIWNKATGHIVGGHQRFKVLLAEGAEEVECVVVDFSDNDEKALNVALNKITGEFDEPKLTDLLSSLRDNGYDLALSGFDSQELDSRFEKVIPEEDDFDVDKALGAITEPKSQRGSVYQLGRHRLMCGDSTGRTDVLKLMDGKQAHMVFTDPPWNVDYGERIGASDDRKIKNDTMGKTEFKKFMFEFFKNQGTACLPGAIVYAVMAIENIGDMMQVAADLEYHWSSTIIWAKDRMVLSRKDYHTQYEPIWYGWTGGARIHPLKDRKQTDLWEIPRPSRSDEHPTMKPLELVARAINNSSFADELVIDLFGGSGTTLIAAEQTGRICNMMELDPKYCDVIINRWEVLTGKLAVEVK